MKGFVAYALSGCSLICIAFTAVSLGTPVWVTLTVENVTTTIGLFERCVADSCAQEPLYTDVDYVKVTQAFLIIALILLVVASIYSVTVAVKKLSGNGIAVIFGLTALCSLIAMAVYSGRQPFTQGGFSYSYGYSYALGWVAYGLELALFPVSLILAKSTEQSYSVMP